MAYSNYFSENQQSLFLSRSIDLEHLQEWRDSLVDDAITHANVQSLYGESPLEAIIGEELERRKPPLQQNYVTKSNAALIERYNHLTEGGWLVTGIDPQKGCDRMDWCQFKPNNPRPKPDKPGEVLKYENPLNVDCRAIFLEDPRRNLTWTEVLADPSIPIEITEGPKKAGTLMTIGKWAIALPGIWMGTRKDQYGIHSLIPDLEIFAQSGRTFTFVFDEDLKRKTRRAVASAICTAANLLEARGCRVLIARWPEAWGKGIDDVAVDKGLATVQEILNEASPIGDQQHLASVRRRQAKAQKEAEQEKWRQQCREAAKKAWLKSRQFTPTEEVNQQYVQFDLNSLLGTDILGCKSGMGTGKTEEIARTLRLANMGAIAIGSRNSLLLQSCERWGGFYHLHNDNAFALTADPQGRIACCIDSLLHFKDSDFDGKIVILDEVVSVLKHSLLSGTLRNRRLECLAKLEQAIKRAAVVIALDGNNCDIAINYLVQLRGENCKVVKQLNKFKADRMSVEMVQSVNQEGQPLLRDYSAVIKKLVETLEAIKQSHGGQAIVFFSDSQRLCEALDNQLSELGYRVFRTDSKTGADKEVKEFLKNPDAYLEQHQIDILIGSPTIESGLDISIRDYFLKGFAAFFGIIDTATQTQFLRRVRACLDWTVWCQEYTLAEDWEGTRSPFVRRLTKQVLDYCQMDAIAAMDGSDLPNPKKWLQQLTEQNQDAHFQTTMQFLAARNYERGHTRECLKIALEEAGHTVTIINLDSNQATKESLSEAKKTIIAADSQAIFRAKDITIAEALKIKSRFGASLEDRFAADKALLKSRLPGIEQTAIWSPDLIAELLFTDKVKIARLERYWKLRNLDKAKAQAQQHYAGLSECDRIFLANASTDFAKLKALDELGLMELLDGQSHTADSDKVQRIYKKVKRSKRLQIALGRSVGKSTPIEFIGRLMALIGIQSKSLLQQVDGERTRSYIYKSIEENQAAAQILACIANRAEMASQQASESDHLSLKEDTYTPKGDHPIPLTQTALQPDLENNPAYKKVRWGTSLSDWILSKVEGAIATIQNTLNGYTVTAPVEELELLEGAA